MSESSTTFDISFEDYRSGFSLTDALDEMLNFEQLVNTANPELPLLTAKRCLNFHKNNLKDAIEVIAEAEFYLNIQPALKPLLETLLKIVNRVYKKTRGYYRTSEDIENVPLHNANAKIDWLTLVHSEISTELNKHHNRDIANNLYDELQSLRDHLRIAEYHKDCLSYRNFENTPKFESVMVTGYWLYNMKPTIINMHSLRNTTDNQLMNYQRALTVGLAVVNSRTGSVADIRAFVLRAINDAIDETSDDLVPVVGGEYGFEVAYLELTRQNLDRIKERLIIRANDRRLELGLVMALNTEIQAINAHMQTIAIQKGLVVTNRSKCLAICGAYMPVDTMYSHAIQNLYCTIDRNRHINEIYEPTRLPSASLTGFTDNSVNRWEVITSDRGQVIGVSLNGKNLTVSSINVGTEPGSITKLSMEVLIVPGQDVLSIVGGAINNTDIVETPSVRYERHVDF